MTEPAPFHVDLAEAPAGGAAFWLRTQDGLRLRAAAWGGGPRGTAVVFPGRTEFIEKYGRVVGRLRALGLSVVVIDWRGQGLSDRNQAAPHLGHVADFRHYQRDVAALLAHPDVERMPWPRHMVAHSMGGCIGLRTLVEGAPFASAIFSAPMWRLQMRAATREITAKVTQLANMLGLGRRLMIGANARPTPLAVAFEGNALTSDPEHFAWAARQVTERPELALGGPNVHWTRAALEEMARLHAAPPPDLPVLAFLGGDESVVSPSVIRGQVARMRRGRLVLLEGARHEIFMERPAIQDRVWAEVAAFLGKVSGSDCRPASVSR